MGFVGNTSLCLLASQFPLLAQFKSKAAAQEFVFVVRNNLRIMVVGN